MANSGDLDETSRFAASPLDLDCLLRPVCPCTYVKYGKKEMKVTLTGKYFLNLFKAE